MDCWTGRHVVSIVALLVASGCPAGDDGESVGSAGSGDSSGDVDDSGSTASTESASTEPTDSTSTATTDSGAGACAAEACGADEYCDYQFDSCGVGSDVGPYCSPLAGCSNIDEPVCGCDGIVYPNQCGAAAAGVDVDAGGGCETPPGLFVCGTQFCDPTESYCTITDSLGGIFYNCVDLPGACGDAPSCACLMDEEFCGGCQSTPDGGFRLTCAGS